ncbi:MAG: signal transduction histidine kinase [halophilic archaeon J07HX5]|nr:MAG: signal transduction histidine kinase [halophilic archaeon J07HX5]
MYTYPTVAYPVAATSAQQMLAVLFRGLEAKQGNMTRESTDVRSVPIDRYPGPACSYRFVDGNPVLTATNDSFAEQIDGGADGAALAAVFDRLGGRVRGDTASLSACLADGTPFRIQFYPDTVPAAEYLVQTVAPTDDEPGFLMFVEQPATAEREVSSALGIDHVASVVSHDLRNPLDVAKARLQAGRELDEDEHFDHVEQAHKRMERIIQDVLTLARGEEVIDPDEVVDLTAVATGAWETVETNGAVLTTDDQLPTATADADRVSRLFENLFRNAVEHAATEPTPTDIRDDGVKTAPVTVTVGCLDSNGIDGFYIADDGPGISPADHARVFEPGYSSDEHGTGLGLAIAARIADLHGWSVAVTQSADGGARFEVSGVEAV